MFERRLSVSEPFGSYYLDISGFIAGIRPFNPSSVNLVDTVLRDTSQA